MSDKPCVWCEGTGFVKPVCETQGLHVSVMCRTCSGTGKAYDLELSVKNLDEMLASDFVWCQGKVVLPEETFKAFVPVWGSRFRFGSELYPVGPRRDFRGWLSTPKGDREIWVGFVEKGRVAFRRKESDFPLL